MSGKKDVVVQVTESQLENIYHRLQTSEQSLKSQENRVNQAIKDVQKKSDEKLTQLKSQMNQQRTKMDQLEVDFAKRMQSQQHLFDQKMRSQTQYVDQRFEKVEAEIESLKLEVLNQAKIQKSYTDAKVLDLKQSIDYQNELEKTHAQSKYDLFNAVFERIQTNQRSRKFIKNQIQELEQYQQDIQQALIDGMYNSAYDRSLTAYQKALEAELELNVNENIWLQYQQFALQQTKLAQAQVISLEDFEVCFPNDQGNVLSEKVDINHWTYGKLDELKVDVEHLLDLLDDKSIENLEIDELKQISEQAQTYRDASNQLLEYSKRSLIKAQERFEIADWLQQEFPLFSVVDAGYLNDDNRETYLVLLRDAQQNEISIRVEPTQDENEIPSHSYKFDFQDINGQIKHFHQAQLEKIQSVITEFHQNTTQEVKLVCKDDDQIRRKEEISTLKSTQTTIGQKTTENHLQSLNVDQQKIKKLALMKKKANQQT